MSVTKIIMEDTKFSIRRQNWHEVILCTGNSSFYGPVALTKEPWARTSPECSSRSRDSSDLHLRRSGRDGSPRPEETGQSPDEQTEDRQVTGPNNESWHSSFNNHAPKSLFCERFCFYFCLSSLECWKSSLSVLFFIYFLTSSTISFYTAILSNQTWSMIFVGNSIQEKTEVCFCFIKVKQNIFKKSQSPNKWSSLKSRPTTTGLMYSCGV